MNINNVDSPIQGIPFNKQSCNCKTLRPSRFRTANDCYKCKLRLKPLYKNTTIYSNPIVNNGNLDSNNDKIKNIKNDKL